MSDESYKTKIQLITPKELCKLREMLIGTEAEDQIIKAKNLRRKQVPKTRNKFL